MKFRTVNTRTGLGYKLWKAFVIQAGLISIAAILSICAAKFVLGDILIRRALINEADHYWMMYEHNDHFPRPDTYNLKGYLSGLDGIPEVMSPLKPGFHKLMYAGVDLYIIYMTERYGRRLYLEFEGDSADELVLFFGTIPLAAVLIFIYLSTWLVYRFSRRAVSPIIQLAKQVDQLDPDNTEHFVIDTNTATKDVDREVVILSRALSDLLKRIEAFVMRERNFTRDASHELRSPITVIKIAADMLLSDGRLDANTRKSIQRIQRSAKDMEELIEALLILARESDNSLSFEPVVVNDLLAEEIERVSILFRDKDIDVELSEKTKLVVNTSDKVLSVLVGNLIRNAFSYTDKGKVHITIDKNSLVIEDSGIGMPDGEVQEVFKPFYQGQSKQRGGYGVGLTIVKMLSDRFNWPVEIESQLNVGTRVTVGFPDAVSQTLMDEIKN